MFVTFEPYWVWVQEHRDLSEMKGEILKRPSFCNTWAQGSYSSYSSLYCVSQLSKFTMYCTNTYGETLSSSCTLTYGVLFHIPCSGAGVSSLMLFSSWPSEFKCTNISLMASSLLSARDTEWRFLWVAVAFSPIPRPPLELATILLSLSSSNSGKPLHPWVRIISYTRMSTRRELKAKRPYM